MAKKNVSIVAIAEEVGLSKTTVSYVLSKKHRQVKIAPKTADRVLEAAKKLGYRSNYWAKSLAQQKTKLIGVLFQDLTSSAAHQLMQGMISVLEAQDYQTVIGVAFWDPKRETKEIELMLDKRVQGIIALPHADNAKAYQLAVHEDCHVVFVGDFISSVKASSVTLDPQDCIEKVVDHLYLQGYRKLRLIGVDYNSPTLQAREIAFKAAMQQRGLHYDHTSITKTKLADESSVHLAFRQTMQSPNPPQAIVCIHDSLAMEGTAELERLGFKVPRDVAIAGIGNNALTDHPFFSLTTVDECRKELGQKAAKLMLDEISHDESSPPQQKESRIKGPLIVRNSSRHPLSH